MASRSAEAYTVLLRSPLTLLGLPLGFDQYDHNDFDIALHLLWLYSFMEIVPVVVSVHIATALGIITFTFMVAISIGVAACLQLNKKTPTVWYHPSANLDRTGQGLTIICLWASPR